MPPTGLSTFFPLARVYHSGRNFICALVKLFTINARSLLSSLGRSAGWTLHRGSVVPGQNGWTAIWGMSWFLGCVMNNYRVGWHAQRVHVCTLWIGPETPEGWSNDSAVLGTGSWHLSSCCDTVKYFTVSVTFLMELLSDCLFSLWSRRFEEAGDHI